MRFQVQLKKEKLKQTQSAIALSLSLIKARPSKYSIYFIYVANQNQIRILIQSQLTPIVIVFRSQVLGKVVSVSKNQTTNSPIGFQFKNGLNFLENFLWAIREDSGNLAMISEEQKMLTLKITKDKDFRSLQIRSNNKLRREEIEKPTKNQNDLFTYEWIDGVSNSIACFEVNPAGINQILKTVYKQKNHYIVQILQQKKLCMQIDIESLQLNLKLKAQGTSNLYLNSKIIHIQGPTRGRYLYEIKIDDAQILILAIKSQCMFVIDQERNLSVSYNSLMHNCQICLKGLINFVLAEGIQNQRGMLKRQM